MLMAKLLNNIGCSQVPGGVMCGRLHLGDAISVASIAEDGGGGAAQRTDGDMFGLDRLC